MTAGRLLRSVEADHGTVCLPAPEVAVESGRLQFWMPAVRPFQWTRLFVRAVRGDRRTGYLLHDINRTHTLVLICRHGLTCHQIQGRMVDATVEWSETPLTVTATHTLTVRTATVTVAGTVPDRGGDAPASSHVLSRLLWQSDMQPWMWAAWCGAHESVPTVEEGEEHDADICST